MAGDYETPIKLYPHTPFRQGDTKPMSKKPKKQVKHYSNFIQVTGTSGKNTNFVWSSDKNWKVKFDKAQKFAKKMCELREAVIKAAKKMVTNLCLSLDDLKPLEKATLKLLAFEKKSK